MLIRHILPAALVAASAIMIAASPASAALMVTFTQGADTLTIVDNGPGDNNSNPGTINFNGTVGSFTINGFIGTNTSTSTGASLSDLAFTTSSTSGGTLQIHTISDNFSLGAATGHATTSVTPTTTPNLSFESIVAGTTVGDFDNLSSGDSSQDSKSVALTDPFQIEHIVDIVHTGAQETSFDSTTRVAVPEPATLALLGVALLGLGVGVGLRRRQQLA